MVPSYLLSFYGILQYSDSAEKAVIILGAENILLFGGMGVATIGIMIKNGGSLFPKEFYHSIPKLPI